MKPPTKAANTAASRVETVAMTEAKRVIRAAVNGTDPQAARDEAAAILAAAFTLAEMVRAS